MSLVESLGTRLALFCIQTDLTSPSVMMSESRVAMCVAFSSDDEDIIDEALYYFKANVFFKSYEVKVGLVRLCKVTVSCVFCELSTALSNVSSKHNLSS